MNRRSSLLILLCAVPTLIYVVMLLFYPNRDLLILWSRDRTPPLNSVLIVAASVITYCIAAWSLLRGVGDESLTRLQRAGLIALVVIGGLALQLAITQATEPDPFVGVARRTYAIATGGYWTVGAPVTDVADFIANYPSRAPLYPVHQMRHPPGLSLIFWLGVRLFELVPALAAPVAAWLRPHSCLSLVSVAVPDAQMASGLFGAIVEIALAMLPIVPLFALVRQLAGTKAAVWSAVLYPLIPGFGIWVSQFDRGFALATMIVLYACERMIADRSLGYALAAGLTLSVSTFCSFGAIPIAMIGGVYALVRIAQTRDFDVRTLALQLALVMVGACSVWLAAFALFRLDPLEMYRVTISSHLSIDIFPFWPFVVWHPWDILTFIGLPIVAITLFAGWRRAAALSAAFWLTLLTLSLAHVARGETGRVWMYFAPVAVAAAAIVIAQRERGEQLAVVGLLATQLIVQASVMRIDTMTDIGFPPETLPSVTIPDDATRVDARFGASGQIALLGYRLSELKPGGEANFTLYWQRMSEAPIDTAYKVFVHVAVDESDQARVISGDRMPMDSRFPTTCWQQGQVVADEQLIRVAGDAQPGEYPVFVGLYDPMNQVRPPTFASPPAQQMHGSVLLPTKVVVR